MIMTFLRGKHEMVLTALSHVFDFNGSLVPAGVTSQGTLVVVVLSVGATHLGSPKPPIVHLALHGALTLRIPTVL